MVARKDLPHGELTHQIIECFYATYRELGSGFSERVYQRALQIVLTENGLRAGYNVEMEVHFHGKLLGTFFADLVVNETVLIEVKAKETLKGPDVGQVINYLKAAGGGVGLLLNFSPVAPEFKRIVQGDPLRSLPRMQDESSSNSSRTYKDEHG